jgi:hypothetical protein
MNSKRSFSPAEADLSRLQRMSQSLVVADAAVALRRFASVTTAPFASSVVASTELSMLLTINNLPGTRQIAIGVGTEQVIALFFAAMVWLMAAVIAQGQQLAEENAHFV